MQTTPIQTEPAPQPADLIAQLSSLLRQANTPPFVAAAPAPWPGPPAFGQPPGPAFSPAGVHPAGLLVPITIPTPQGDLSAYLQLPAEALSNVQSTLAQLAAQGWPLRFYQPRGGGWQGGPGGNGAGRQWGRRW